jgi:GR25 family glycosyltransferase involved in LPS biosynthesis
MKFNKKNKKQIFYIIIFIILLLIIILFIHYFYIKNRKKNINKYLDNSNNINIINNDIIIIGSSNNNLKKFNISSDFKNNTYIIDQNNLFGSLAQAPDFLRNNKFENYIFEVKIKNGICKVKRIDSNSGWNLHLIIYAELNINNINNNSIYDINNIPIFFINLEKDTARLEHMQNMLSKIFDKKNIYRINGVQNKLGLEGCRLAHINANITAINYRFPYYLIVEEDIQPLLDTNQILDYIKNSTNVNPDLVLFEQGQDLEKKIKLELNNQNKNLYRIYSGGNNTGCYMCNRNFGIKLVEHWTKFPNEHIDGTWQILWKDNDVYFHRPQLFHQKEGPSNQSDIDYRETIKPFDWKLYENINIHKNF